MTSSLPRPAVGLAPLVAALPGARVSGTLDRPIAALADDSRAVREGSLFVALRGERADGHDFVADAAARGAAAIVVDALYAAAHPAPAGPTTIVVDDTRAALSRLAAAYFGRPSSALRVIGVTGTNGKTTVTSLACALLCEAGIAAGSIGTLGARLGEKAWPLGNTTPLPLELHSLLAAMRERGAAAVAMEVSSHALALERVADVDFTLGVLTNVTRDHLDFHGTFEAYAAAKRRLFEVAARAVLNADDPLGRRWAAELAAAGREPLAYGLGSEAAVRAEGLEVRASGSSFSVGGTRFELLLPGRFNVSNALAVLCVARELGVSDATSARVMAAFRGVPGRMEHFSGGGVDVLVDYAHTPDALESVLRAAREAAGGELAVVFGCGGDRDRGKRPEMGRIARALADRVVVTSDNPRREEPRAIVEAIVAGIGDARGVTVELDRRAAIRRAIAAARPGDVVVVAGKGHETYQIVGEEIVPFDDRDEVRAALAAREPGPGA
ncbi:MAG: UDP-N-acetylmuramoyl-L-alanyl-D-glutamate--2,6-diaminopimelate ligase [Candidatus Baltobacteraceae bacterium]